MLPLLLPSKKLWKFSFCYFTMTTGGIDYFDACSFIFCSSACLKRASCSSISFYFLFIYYYLNSSACLSNSLCLSSSSLFSYALYLLCASLRSLASLICVCLSYISPSILVHRSSLLLIAFSIFKRSSWNCSIFLLLDSTIFWLCWTISES
jgi:hypothetical protein